MYVRVTATKWNDRVAALDQGTRQIIINPTKTAEFYNLVVGKFIGMNVRLVRDV